jgi:hypothetical protein
MAKSKVTSGPYKIVHEAYVYFVRGRNGVTIAAFGNNCVSPGGRVGDGYAIAGVGAEANAKLFLSALRAHARKTKKPTKKKSPHGCHVVNGVQVCPVPQRPTVKS